MNLINRIQALECNINENLKANNVLVRIIENEGINKGKIIILKDKKINRIFEIEMISCCQINIIETNKIIESGLFIDCLCQWIFNLYNPVEYLYVFYGGELNGKTLTRQQVNKISNETTKNYHKERSKGLLVHKEELDNQPIVKNYLGPMFEKIDYGKIYLRYETQEIYDMLSE